MVRAKAVISLWCSPPQPVLQRIVVFASDICSGGLPKAALSFSLTALRISAGKCSFGQKRRCTRRRLLLDGEGPGCRCGVWFLHVRGHHVAIAVAQSALRQHRAIIAGW